MGESVLESVDFELVHNDWKMLILMSCVVFKQLFLILEVSEKI